MLSKEELRQKDGFYEMRFKKKKPIPDDFKVDLLATKAELDTSIQGVGTFKVTEDELSFRSISVRFSSKTVVLEWELDVRG